MLPSRHKTTYPAPCPYCGKIIPTRSAGSKDHVVPKAAFAIVPDDVLTVTCCKPCNNVDKSRDDQAFGVYLGLSLGSDVSVQHSVFDKVTRPTLRKNRKLYRRLAASVRPIQLQSPGGVYLGVGMAVQNDVAMHNRVVWRIVQGLHYRIYGSVLAPDTPHEVITQQPFTKAFLETIRNFQRGSMGGDQFQYAWFRGSPIYAEVSLWLLQFHKREHVAVAVNGQQLSQLIKDGPGLSAFGGKI